MCQAHLRTNLAIVLVGTGRHQEADQLLEQAIATYAKLAGSFREDVAFRNYQA